MRLAVGGAAAVALAGSLVPGAAGAFVLHKAYSVVASNADITSRCAVSVNTYNLLTKKTNIGIQASTQPAVGATSSPYQAVVSCVIYDANGFVDGASSSALGASTYVNKTIQLANGSYQLCVFGSAALQYGSYTQVNDCTNFTL